MIETKISQFILDDVDFTNKKYLENTLKLITEGATIPFISRYRKEATNNLDEEQLRTIEEKLTYYTDLEKRKETILNTISEQGKLTDQLKKQIVDCKNKNILEDLYLPYKPKRRTKATIAKEQGLEPLAKKIMAQDITSGDKESILSAFVNPEKDVKSTKDALSGALNIIAEEISDNSAFRGWIRNYLYSYGVLKTSVKKDFANEKTKYEMYYDYEEPIKKIPSHRMLAIRRGATEKVLGYSLSANDSYIKEYIEKQLIGRNRSIFTDDIKAAIDDSYKRLIHPSIESELLTLKKDEADEEAINVFSKNLRSLLLSPPAGAKVVMGVDPGFRTGCKVTVVNETGKYMDFKAIYPNEPQKKTAEAEQIILNFIEKYGVELIAIGNGTASRETDLFIADVIKKNKIDVTKIIVSEAGASVYSASEVAKKEFPDLDVTVRGAISIARRLKDPLAELVKIDPKSIGVGQYQHDVNQSHLKKSLESVVESCVNFVGVEINTASTELLSYVSGIGPTLAKNIVNYRDSNGSVKTRKELLKVPKLGPKAFEQAAGFLRVRESANPLDNSSVHPESYYVVEKMAKELNVKLDNLIGNVALLEKLDLQRYVDDKVGLMTLTDIVNELKKPGRDPRQEFKVAKLNDTVTEISDLKEGMLLEGTVTNVTNFGAFVDVGVHQDGLVHVSQLADRFVKDPNDIVKPGDIVKIKVLSVDVDRKRLSFTMKL